MPISVIRPVIEPGRRIIVIGDINGNDEAFTKLLAKAEYSKKDILIILGNLVEEGPDSLRTLRHVMELSQNGDVYCLLGSSDVIVRELLRNDRNEELLQHILKNENCIIADMLKTCGIPLKKDSNMFLVKQSLRVLYEREIAFVCAMPHILETEHFMFAHAQVYPGNPEDMKPSEVIRGDAFLNKGFSFRKYVVVGHWPVMLYGGKLRKANPIVNSTRKIICLNGGISVQRDGQLNALIIPDESSEEFSFICEDMLPKGRVLNSQMAGETANTLTWPNNVVIPLERTGDFVYCKQDKTDLNFWVPESFLKCRDGVWYSEDITDYQIPVSYGEIVSVILKTSRGYLVKKNGVAGWYYGMLEPLGKE